jgi:septum site-determining protein MinC
VRQSVRLDARIRRLPSAIFSSLLFPLSFFAASSAARFLYAHDSMTVAIQATSPATFEIKSANLPLVALLLKSTDLVALARELDARFGDIPDFFDQDALMIDLSPLQTAAQAGRTVGEIDFPALITLLGSYQLVPLSVKGGSPAQMAAALQAGLLPVPDAHLVPARPVPTTTPAPAEPVHTPTATPPPAPQGAMVIDKPLRSGQQVYARGRDLVVLAMVNAGAEVIADGHIHVYAPLRGKAMAGARGNADARIFSLALEAELLSIAGVYRTSEHPLPAGMAGKPTQVRLVPGEEGDKLVMNVMAA